MKISRYNHFLPRGDGKIIAFNCRTGGLALMEESKYQDYQYLASHSQEIESLAQKKEYGELVSKLKMGRFLLDDQVDEVAQLELRNRLSRFDTSLLGLIVAPTLACNFKCEYCFEEVKKGHMSSETVDALVNFVREKAPALKTLSCTWYGGEPLLRMDLIEKLSTDFINICREHKIAYGAAIMTNGYLLTKKMASRLRNLSVSGAQVCLDGPQRVQDLKRPLANGEGSYEVILKNLVDVKDLLDISLRINVDKTTRQEDFAELLDDLEKNNLRDQIKLFFGNVEAANEVCINIAENCYDNKSFSKVEVLLHKIALDRGFGLEKLPSPLISYCCAQSMHSYIVDPQGELYKCFNDVGITDRSCGNLRCAVDPFHPNLFPFLNWNPLKNDNCRECEVLPLCMGGCPHRIIFREEESENNCDSWKYNLEDMLEIVCRFRLKQRAKS
ncbi:MAG: SPASM domain-containing protein [Candidatus Zixiibacteriota bacterium]|nr:MAG: SPASM domain-containing protein [candidate division Zixibacteria bacterium]